MIYHTNRCLFVAVVVLFHNNIVYRFAFFAGNLKMSNGHWRGKPPCTMTCRGVPPKPLISTPPILNFTNKTVLNKTILCGDVTLHHFTPERQGGKEGGHVNAYAHQHANTPFAPAACMPNPFRVTSFRAPALRHASAI